MLALDFPNDPHVLHMAPLMKWHSTTGSLAPNKGLNGVCVYESGDGWAISPETNWKTAKLVPELGSTTGARTPFAHLNAWSDIPQVKVATNPESLQLVLFPHEEFEYLAVNLTAFAGDVIDGRMAMQEHFRKRFRYHGARAKLRERRGRAASRLRRQVDERSGHLAYACRPQQRPPPCHAQRLRHRQRCAE